MLYRKYSKYLEKFLRSEQHKILLLNGARQIGKSYIIREVGKKMFKNYIEINLKEDKESVRIFENVRNTNDFYVQFGAIYGKKLDSKENTLIFLDEIQSYPHMMTMLKFLNQEARYTYIASGSQLGVALSQTASVPLGSVAIDEMYPLDFEEFLLAMDCAQSTIDALKESFASRKSLNESMHNFMIQQFKLYLLVGGMPEAINKFKVNRNITHVRSVQTDIYNLYRIDSSQYDNEHKLSIRKIYDMIPSNMENRKKRIIAKRIEDTAGHKQFSDYADEFEYLTNSGVALSVQAVSNPRFPLLESERKNLLKLYINDVGILTNLLYDRNINAVLRDENSVNLGAVYESVVAQELHAHGFPLYYYDNKQKGEVDFLIDNFSNLKVLPIVVKSGKDYSIHSALNNFINNPDYNISEAVVFSNSREVKQRNGITYMPIYYCMFFERHPNDDCIIPEILLPQDF